MNSQNFNIVSFFGEHLQVNVKTVRNGYFVQIENAFGKKVSFLYDGYIDDLEYNEICYIVVNDFVCDALYHENNRVFDYDGYTLWSGTYDEGRRLYFKEKRNHIKMNRVLEGTGYSLTDFEQELTNAFLKHAETA